MRTHPFFVKIEDDIEAVVVIDVTAEVSEDLLADRCSRFFFNHECIVVALASNNGEERRVASLEELRTLCSKIEITAVVRVPHRIINKYFPPNG